MNLPFLWQIYFVSLIAHRIQCPKWSKEFSLEFSILLGFDVLVIQPNFVARGIAFKLRLFVVILLLEPLCMLEIFSSDSHQLFELDCQLVYWLWLRARINVFFVGGLRVIVVVEFERNMTGASIIRIIVGEFGHRQEHGPIILRKTDKISEVGFHGTILTFRLAISLWVKSV